jgi:hypothetical protein
MTGSQTAGRLLRSSQGTTLIELVSALAVLSVVISSLYLLLGAGIRGRLIVHARVSDQERGRHALTWLVDRLRQVSYDARAVCPDGLILAGSGTGFDRRLAFRAVIDERAVPTRRIYVFYAQDRTLWQEAFAEEKDASCVAEANRLAPHPRRTALAPGIIRAFDLAYYDGRGAPAVEAATVRSVGIALRLEAESTPGRTEVQTYHTLVTLRGP